MAAVSWSPTLAAVDAALLTATGTDLAIGADIRAWLYAFGTLYDSAYTSAADAAKASSVTLTAAALAAWSTATEALHDQADEAARYVYSLFGVLGQLETPTLAAPYVLTFDPNVPDAVATRLYNAGRIARENGSTGFDATLLAHQAAMTAARNAKPSSFVPVAPYDSGVSFAAPAAASGKAPSIELPPSTLRQLETALSAQVTYATDWIAQTAFVS